MTKPEFLKELSEDEKEKFETMYQEYKKTVSVYVNTDDVNFYISELLLTTNLSIHKNYGDLLPYFILRLKEDGICLVHNSLLVKINSIGLDIKPLYIAEDTIEELKKEVFSHLLEGVRYRITIETDFSFDDVIMDFECDKKSFVETFDVLWDKIVKAEKKAKYSILNKSLLGE